MGRARTRLSIAALLAVALGGPLRAEPVAEELLVVVGVPGALEREVRGAAEAVLAELARPARVLGLDALGPDGRVPAGPGARLVALGAEACRRLVAAERPLTCALLSIEAFASIACPRRCDGLEAIVMDQPVSRQIAVARAVYPALRRFGVLSAHAAPEGVPRAGAGSATYRRFRADESLTSQLDAALAANDALVALPESPIFNRSSLRVVLLTAYGYAKPVIGFGRAYVTAGALISAYSTPEQILREALAAPAAGRPAGDARADGARVRAPTRFSVAENPRIARSLGLDRRRDVDPGRTYSDGDFPE